MRRTAARETATALLAGFILAAGAAASSIVGSPHDFSTLGAEMRVCIFCHTPHHSTVLKYPGTSPNPDYPGPLWNLDENTRTDYTPYTSRTIAEPEVSGYKVASWNNGKVVRQPHGPSRLCLSCHDGTIAVAHGTNVTIKATKVLGKNLSDDHPVSIEYDIMRAGDFADTEVVRQTSRVKLMPMPSSGASNPFVECTSCHDPHDNQFGNFLVVDTSSQRDALCTVCHTPRGWTESAHKGAASIAAKGCINCHVPHGAQQGEDLLTLPGAGGIDSNCTASCHNGTSGRSIGTFSHGNGADAAGVEHNGAENLAVAATWGTDPLPVPAANKHVHCVDCHNPHQAVVSPATPPTPPDVNGVLKGVRGVDISGNPRGAIAPYAQHEYEICFRCHSGNDAKAGNFNGVLPVVRTFSSYNEQERFNTSSAVSWHPVAGDFIRTGSSTGYTLINPALKTISCNDCHDPHGSALWGHNLRKQNTATFSQSSGIFDLCYSCHDSDKLNISNPNARSARLHKAHVGGSHQNLNDYKASCSNCHDPHGVPGGTGGNLTNAAHLVNFDTKYAGAGSTYDATAGSCMITPGTGSPPSCHATVNPYSLTTYDSFFP